MNRFKKFAAFCLGYNVLVILWGAYVRATGSGAGCGSHWPLCNGEVIPRPERIQTWIELTHRLSSGLCLVFVIILMAWARRSFPKKHPARTAAHWSFGLTISEALVGAALVLLALVEHDQSVRRAISISIHLVNTLFLLGALTLTVRHSNLPAEHKPIQNTWNGKPKRWFITAIVSTILLGTTGALTALGDTLFQSKSLASGFAQDFASESHFLVKLRVFHPAMAVITAIVLYLYSEFAIRWSEPPQGDTHTWARALQALVLVQMAIGGTNLLLLAPIGLQMVHLLLADLIWISLIMLSSAILTRPSSSIRM